MKKLRTILAALATLRKTPSAAIASAWDRLNAGNGSTEADHDLIDSIIGAVVSLAKDDEDKATKPCKADKPAT